MYEDALYGAIVNWYRDTSKDRYASVLYAWVSFYGDDYIYTTTLTPNESTFLYPGEGTTATKHSFASFSEADSILSLNVVRNASSGVVEPEVRYDRASNKDIILKSTSYTDSTTLVKGATLYNNLGKDSGMKVGTVISDGSFTAESIVTITFVPYTGAGAWSGSYEGTVNNIPFVSAANGYDGCTPNTFSVTKGQPCTITAENTSKGDGIVLRDSAGIQVAYEYTSFEYTFTPTEDCTFEIGANIEPA